MRTAKPVSAGLDLIAKRIKQYPELGKFLDDLDRLEKIIGADENSEQHIPLNKPYSGEELPTTDRWK